MRDAFGVDRVSKKDERKLHPAAVGAATAGGALAGQSAYMMVTPFNNRVMKPHFERKMKEYGPDSPQAKTWREWNKPPQWFRGGEKPDLVRPLTQAQAKKESESNTKRAAWRGSKEFHRKFPKGLPGWRTHRALAWAGKGLTGHATAATAMGLGALASYKVATHEAKPKRTEVKKWGYVPKSKSMMTPKLLMQDPGFVVPVAGVTAAGVAGTGLALRKKKRKK